MLQSTYIDKLLKEILSGDLAVRDGIFDGIMKRRMVSRMILEGNISSTPELQEGTNLDEAYDSLSRKISWASYRYTENVLVRGKGSSPLKYANKNYAPKKLSLERFKVISAAGCYAFSSYASQRYNNWFGEFEEIEGNQLDGLLALMEQEKRFFENMLVALTDEEHEKINESILNTKSKQSDAARNTSEKRHKRFKAVDEDVEKLARAWWHVSKKIRVENLSDAINNQISMRRYSDRSDSSRGGVLAIPDGRVKRVVVKVKKELNIKLPRGRSPDEYTVQMLEKQKKAPKEWVEFKKNTKKQKNN